MGATGEGEGSGQEPKAIWTFGSLPLHFVLTGWRRQNE